MTKPSAGAVTVVKPTFEWYNFQSQMTLGATFGLRVFTLVPNGSYYYNYYGSPRKANNTRQTVGQAVVVSMSSENPAVIQVPATATIEVGSYETTFNIQAVGTGTSTLTASTPGWDS